MPAATRRPISAAARRDRPLASLRRLAAAHVLQLPGLGVVAAALELAVFDGGYAASTWYPVAALALALLVVGWFVVGRLWSVPGPVAIGLGAYAAFCLWSYASILWAASPGAALEGASRALLYLLALTVVAVAPWPVRAARAALALVVIGAAALAAGTISSLPAGGAFVDGRLVTPLGYANATASFWCIAFWLALALATGPARSSAARAVRPVALAGAGLLAQTALLSQSRGAVLAFGATTLLFLALTPRRGPALLALLGLTAVTALHWDTLMDVRSAASAPELAGMLADARTAIVASALALLLAAILFEGLMALAPRLAARLGAASVGNFAAAVTAIVALGVAAPLAIGNPSAWVDDRWKDFKSARYDDVAADGSRLTGSLGSGRYDYWRVALDEFRAHPLVGIGADNFPAAYRRERRTLDEPRHPHSLAMALVSEVGSVGAAAFLVFLGALLTAAWRARRRADRLVSAALLSAFAMWFVHQQVDQLWGFTALGMLAFALLGIAARLQHDGAAPEPEPERERAVGVFARDPYAAPPVALVVVVVTGALAVAVALVALAAAARAARQATDRTATAPRAAIDGFEQAARLNPLTADPLVREAVIARRLGDRVLARRSLQRALERESDNWRAQFELAVLDATSGSRERALRRLARARRLNPRQRVIVRTARAVRRGAAIDPDAAVSPTPCAGAPPAPPHIPAPACRSARSR
jgi:tetratricopeptide (TPR) repeat protein